MDTSLYVCMCVYSVYMFANVLAILLLPTDGPQSTQPHPQSYPAVVNAGNEPYPIQSPPIQAPPAVVNSEYDPYLQNPPIQAPPSYNAPCSAKAPETQAVQVTYTHMVNTCRLYITEL